jgi:hypothetical protein
VWEPAAVHFVHESHRDLVAPLDKIFRHLSDPLRVSGSIREGVVCVGTDTHDDNFAAVIVGGCREPRVLQGPKNVGCPLFWIKVGIGVESDEW